MTAMLARALLAFGLAALPAVAQSGWKLVWSDEFNGTSIDRTKWDYDLGRGNPIGWGNAELENYTDRTENSRVENGNLVIEARKETYQGSQYTSARMVTRGKFSRTYGRFEARIRIPYGQGIWPAFWMLGDDVGTVGWPKCGEIDIMEVIGKEPYTLYGTAHMPPTTGGSSSVSVGGTHLTNISQTGPQIHDDFHVFAVEWGPDEIRWFYDKSLYKTFKKSDAPANATWVFDKPFHILLNVAVGGRWPGYPDSTTQFPQQMLVDYVRVYEQTKPSLAPERAVVNGASFLTGIAPGTWITIAGDGLAGRAREWSAGDFANSFAPTSLEGTRVLIDAKPAYVGYISPTQLNVVAPDVTPGRIPVQVIRDGAATDTVLVDVEPMSPAFFLWQGKYAVAHRHPNWDPIAPAGLFPSLTTAPAKPGDIVILWGAGFGPTDPTSAPGQVPPIGAKATTPIAVRVGGQQVDLVSAVLSPYVGVYQIAIRLPESLPDGEHAVTAELSGVTTPQPAILAVSK